MSNSTYPEGMSNLDPAKVDLRKLADKARGDIALANPVSFLIRIMSSGELDGESVDVRARMDIAKFLSTRWLPQLQAMELSDPNGNSLLPPPLTIMLSVTKNDLNAVTEAEAVEMKTVEQTLAEGVQPIWDKCE